ncbi:MAG: hypothetical protein C4570_07710 [Ammonifex sp.]|nr:MAG: hypothetical protein C4570_07710 [Ammonifex sp.]
MQICPRCQTENYSAATRGSCHKCGTDLTGVPARPAGKGNESHGTRGNGRHRPKTKNSQDQRPSWQG